MERQEWERWQRRHMLAKSTPDGDNRLMQLTADLVGTSRQRLKAKRHGSTAEYEAAKAVHEAAYTTLKEALAKSAREASAKVTK